jgi:hypothetical protein
MRYLVLLLVAACGVDVRCDCRSDAAVLPTCDELECSGLACGTVTPNGVEHPERCTCMLPDDAGYTTCEAR